MRFKNHAILLLTALLLLSACDQRVSPSNSPTLSKLGPNMQEKMERALAQSGYWNMPPSPKPTEANALNLSNF